MPPIPPTKKKPSSDLDALMAAANAPLTRVAEPPSAAPAAKGNSDLDALMAAASKKKVGTTDGGTGVTTSAPSPSSSEAQSPSTTDVTGGQTLGNNTPAPSPEAFVPSTHSYVDQLLGKINNSPVRGDIASFPGTNAPANTAKSDEVVAQRNEAITNTALENLKRKRGVYDKKLPPPTKDEINTEKEAVTQAYNNNDIAPVKEGNKIVMKRTTGFAQTALKGLNDAYMTDQENNYFASLSKEEKIRYLNIKQQAPSAFETTDNSTTVGSKVDLSFGLSHDGINVDLGEFGSALNNIGGFVGENAAMMEKGAVGAIAAAEAAPAVAASSAGLIGTAGAGNFGSFLALANQFGKGGYTNLYQKTYYALKKQGLSDEEAADKADTAGLRGEMTQLGVGAALSTNIGATLPEAGIMTEFNVSGPPVDAAVKGFAKLIDKYVAPVANNEFVKMTGSSAAASLAESEAQKQAGVKLNTEDVLRDAVNQGGSGFLTAFSFWGMHKAAQVATSIPSYIRPLLENVAASTPVEAREAYLNKAVEQGVMTEDEKVKISKTVNQFGETKPAVNDLPIPEEKKAAITGKLVQVKKLEEQRDNLSKYGSSFNDKIGQIDAQISTIHEDINKMYGADDVFEHESDSLTGEKPTTAPAVVMPNEVNRPTTETTIAPDEILKPDTKDAGAAVILPQSNTEPNIVSLNGENQTATTTGDSTVQATDPAQESQTLPSNESPTPQEAVVAPSEIKPTVDESQATSTEKPIVKGNEGTNVNNEPVTSEKGSSTQTAVVENQQAARQDIEKRRKAEFKENGLDIVVFSGDQDKWGIDARIKNAQNNLRVVKERGEDSKFQEAALESWLKDKKRIDEINAKYDSELADLQKQNKPIDESQAQSTEKPIVKADEGTTVSNEPVTSKEESGTAANASEDKQGAKQEIEKRRQEELKGEEYRTPVSEEVFEGDDINHEGEKIRIKITTNKDGSRTEYIGSKGDMFGEGEGESWSKTQTISKDNTISNEDWIQRAWKAGENFKKVESNKIDKSSNLVDRINDKYDAELAALDKKQAEPKPDNSVTTNTNQDASSKSEVPKQEVPKSSSEQEHARTSQEQNTEKPQTNGGNSPVGSESKPKGKVSRTKASGSLRNFSAKIREEGLLPHWAKADLPEGTQSQGFGGKSLDEAVAKAIDLVADAIDAGKGLSESVNEGFKHLQDYYTENTKSFNGDKLKREFKINIRKQLGVDEGYERRFTKQVLSDEAILPKKEIAKKLEYVRQGNELTIQEATKLIDDVGVDEAYNLIVNEGDLKPAVRSTVGQMLIKKYNTLAREATDQATKEKYWDKTIDTADLVSEKMATGAGQMIQAFSLYEKLSPEAQVRSTIREAKKSSEVKKTKQRQVAKDISEKLNQANADAIDEVLGSNEAKVTVEKVENNRKEKAKQKAERARAKRKEIIEKYKNDKGKTLYSTVPGLTVEGMEYVGNLAKTYIDEGMANVDLISEKIREHLVATTSKPTRPEVDADVAKAVREKLNQADQSLLGKGLKDMKADINKLVKEHFTESNKTKRELADKLAKEAGLHGDDAKELAQKVNDAFDRIATKKKMAILEREKAKFDALQNGLQGAKKVDRKQVQDEIVKMSNLGAFENDQLLEVVGKKLGLGEVTPEQAQRVQDLAEKVQAAPEGAPKRDATQDLLNYRANIRGTSLLEVGQGIWYANVLSGYKTHEKNVVSTFIDGFMYYASEVARDPSSLPFLTVGGVKGLKRGAFEAWHTLTTGRSPMHVLNIETSNVLERKKFVGGFLNPANYLKYVTRAMVAEDVLQFQGLKEMKAYQLAYSEAKKEGLTKPNVGIWQRVNEKLYNTSQREAIALQQIKDEGIKGIEAKRRMYELMEMSRPVEMTEQAYGFAAKGTFNHETEGALGALTDLVSHALDMPIAGARPIRFLVPFTKIIANVVNNALDFGPVGAIRAARGVRGFQSFEGSKFLKGKYRVMSTEERQQTIAKAALGIGLTAALYAMTKVKKDDGEPLIDITGAGTGDYKKDSQLKLEGWQPYSIKIGSHYLSYAYTPLVFNLAWIGNWNDREKYDKNADSESFLKKVSMNAFQSVSMISDMTWISTSANLLNALSSQSGGSSLVDKAGKELANSAKSFVLPNAYTQAAQQFEALNNIPQKEVNGIFDNFIQDVPIARNSLNDKINALGEPIIRDPDVFMSKETQDPTWKFLLDKKGWIAPVNKNSLVVFKGTGKERLATQDEYYEFAKERGKKMKAALENIRLHGAWLDSKGKATVSENQAVRRKAPEDLTPTDMREIIRGLSTKVTKQVKKKQFALIAE